MQFPETVSISELENYVYILQMSKLRNTTKNTGQDRKNNNTLLSFIWEKNDCVYSGHLTDSCPV